MFQPIKSPVGESVGLWSYWSGTVYMTEETAQLRFSQERFKQTTNVANIYHMQPHPSLSFADWLEAQGVRLV